MTPKQTAFLAAFAECGVIKQASEAAGCDKSNHCRWVRESDEYREAFAQSQIEATDNLEAEARRRAVDGWEEPVFYEGEVVGHKRKYSDTLLIFLLKGNNPGKFGDKVTQTHQGQVQGQGQGSVFLLPDNSRDPEQTRNLVREALNHPEYVEYLRQQDLLEDCEVSTPCSVDEAPKHKSNGVCNDAH